MPYIPEQLKTEAFVAGQKTLYNVVQTNPQLRMVPVDQHIQVRDGLKTLGYKFRIRWRGPRHVLRRDTLKLNAHAFTVYIIQ